MGAGSGGAIRPGQHYAQAGTPQEGPPQRRLASPFQKTVPDTNGTLQAILGL
jgi:hypothetical protein